jgi:hypothetical protein
MRLASITTALLIAGIAPLLAEDGHPDVLKGPMPNGARRRRLCRKACSWPCSRAIRPRTARLSCG